MMEEPPTLSKYGRMRERYLREHRKAFYLLITKLIANTVFKLNCTHN